MRIISMIATENEQIKAQNSNNDDLPVNENKPVNKGIFEGDYWLGDFDDSIEPDYTNDEIRYYSDPLTDN
jgi:hypothetical protein